MCFFGGGLQQCCKVVMFIVMVLSLLNTCLTMYVYYPIHIHTCIFLFVKLCNYAYMNYNYFQYKVREKDNVSEIELYKR